MSFYASIRLMNIVSVSLEAIDLLWHPDGYPYAIQKLVVTDEDHRRHDVVMHLADQTVAEMVRDGHEVKGLPKGEREERRWGYVLKYLQKCTTDAELASAMGDIKMGRVAEKDQIAEG